MKSIILFFGIMMSVFLNSCDNATSPKDKDTAKQIRELSASEKQIVESNKKFGLNLFKKVVVQEDASKDIFISPLSVSMALGMTLNGADGTTYDAMQQTLAFEGLTNEEINKAYHDLIDLLTKLDDKVLFEIANSIWYRNTFQVENSFLETNKNWFDAEISASDFNNPGTVDIINNWVSDKTHEKIKTIINNIDPNTVMFLINAIYFNGTWKYEFDKDDTYVTQFNLDNGSVADCEMMQITGEYKYFRDSNVQIVDLPYGDGEFSMTVFLPARGNNINEFVNTLDESQWDYYLTNMQADSGTIELPKFKLEYKLTMNDVLKALGMEVAFNPSAANFSRINATAQLFISKVLHKTFVKVDEEGTEAAAVTAVIINLTSVGDLEKFNMRVDRPFVFTIRENHSGSILFIGKMMQPVWEE